MRTKLIYILLLLLLTTCTGNRETETTPPALYPQPKTFVANPDGGYVINPFTGDTIHPVILLNGDTLITGKPILAMGSSILPDSVSQPEMVDVSAFGTEINAQPNVKYIADNLKVIAVVEDSLKVISTGEIAENDTIHYMINGTGNKIKTGSPIPAQGKIVASFQPMLTQALLPRFKDGAITNLKYLDVDQGLASSYVYSILQDRSGNMWFGTYGGGVSKYNGSSFTHYTIKEGLSSNDIYSMLEDKSGNLWFGTNGGGVSMYDGKKIMQYAEKEGLASNSIICMLQDKSGNLWFCSNGGGVCRYDGKLFTRYTENEGLSYNSVWSILEDKNGNIWFGTGGGGANKYDGKSFTHYTTKDGLFSNEIYSMLEDKYGNIWFATNDGVVCKYDGKSFTHYAASDGLSSYNVNSMLEDKSGNIWFGTNGGGVLMFDGKSFTQYTEKDGLPNNDIYSMLEDNSGNIWFGTLGGGAGICNGNSFMHYTQKEGLSNNSVIAILEDKSGNLWFGTNGGGVNKYDGKSFTHFTKKEGLSSINILSMLEDKKGNLWFGTMSGGVLMYNGKSFIHYSEKQGLSNNMVLSMLEDKSGNIWFGTYGAGIISYDGKSFTHYKENENLSINDVFAILEDKSGNIWFGTHSEGVCKYDGKCFTHYSEKEGLPNDVIWSMFEDKNGNIWFGTNGSGLCKYDGKYFTLYTEEEGLVNNTVWSIVEDKNGNIWLGTEKGLSILVFGSAEASNIKYPEISENVSIKTINKQGGLNGIDFFRNSVCLDSKNRIWWGSGKSLTMLDMNKFSLSTKPPSVILKQLDINEQFIDYRNSSDSLVDEIKFSGVQQFENYPLNLELPFYKNHLTFHFCAIDWYAPDKVKFSYIMEGLNTNWSHPSVETKADFRNLPYGKYTFKVCAIGESGVWSGAFDYKFTIHPPWWHTTWFRLLAALGFVLFLFLLYRWRTAKLKQRQKELETEVENATLEIRVQKEEVEKQKDIIEEAHKEITDSINYAGRIQRSFLATKELLDENLNDYFVFFQPRHTVSGDFYWASKLNNGDFAVVNADSTGHGVPGAIMSILNISSIEKSIETASNPNLILNNTRKFIIDRLSKDGSKEGGKDGMDCSIIVFNEDKTELTFAAANNPVWIVRNGELIEFKGDKLPVGKHDRDSESFTLQRTLLQKGDIIYTLTDGFQDQFGGDQGKKFMVKKLKELILSLSHLPMNEQKNQLSDTFSLWKGTQEQVDDVCLIGIRI